MTAASNYNCPAAAAADQPPDAIQTPDLLALPGLRVVVDPHEAVRVGGGGGGGAQHLRHHCVVCTHCTTVT